MSAFQASRCCRCRAESIIDDVASDETVASIGLLSENRSQKLINNPRTQVIDPRKICWRNEIYRVVSPSPGKRGMVRSSRDTRIALRRGPPLSKGRSEVTSFNGQLNGRGLRVRGFYLLPKLL